MEGFFIYLIKSAICLALFLTVYMLFFRKTTFIVFNRIYLFCGMLASLVIPLFTFTYDVILRMAINQTTAVTETTPIIAEQGGISWWQIGLLAYITGAILLLLRNMTAYYRFAKLVRTGETFHTMDGIKFINNDSVKSPFTVLNYILLDNKELSITEEKLIIKHEITHVKQKHWIDLICGECMLVLQWFNPFVWLYISLQKENHEFLADRAVLEDGTSPAIYQAVLINRQFGGPVFSFSNSFNYSKPLTRLIMMKKTKSSPIRKMALLILVPAFGVFMWATAKPNYIVEYANLADSAEIQQDSANITIAATETQITGEYNTDPTLHFRGSMIMDDDNPPLIVINGKEYPNIDMSNVDVKYIKSISVIKGKEATKKYGDKAKNGVMEITMEKGYDYSALKKKSNANDVKVGIAIADDTDGNITVYHSEEDFNNVNSDTSKGEASEVRVIGYGRTDDLNGDVKTIVRTINDSTKGQVTTKIIKIEDKNGGENTDQKTRLNLKFNDDKNGKPLIILDGKEIPYEEMDSIDPNSIESISVLKDKASTEKYGEKAKNGVIIIERKK